MLDSIPKPAWTILIDYLGLKDSCQLRILSKSIRNRIDEDIYHIYKRIEGKPDMCLTSYLNTKFIYPILPHYLPCQNLMINHFGLNLKI